MARSGLPRRAARLGAGVLLCMALLSGCGSSALAPTAAAEPVTLRFAVRGAVADYAALAEEFHRQNPRITIQIVSIGQGQSLGGGLETLKAQGIDAFRDTVAYPPDPKLQTELLPLDERMNANKGFPRADMFPGVMDAMKTQGIQYGIAAGLNPYVAYYDNLRFKSAKATPPGADWTLTDLLQAAVAVNRQENTDPSSAEFGYGFCSEPISADPIIITYLFGGQLLDNLLNPTQPTLDSPANVRAVQWYANLRRQYGVTPDPDELKRLFRTRGLAEAIVRARCGFWLGFYSDLGGRTWGTRWTGEPVMLPLPRGQASFNVASVDGYYILRQSKRPDEAWKWIVFLVERQEASGALMPVRRSHVESSAFAGRVSADVLRVARSLPSNTIILGATTPQNAESIFSIYLAAVDQVVREGLDANAALAAAQSRAQAVFVGAR